MGTIKTTIVHESPKQRRQDMRASPKEKTYTKVTIGKERIIGEKRYILNPDGTKNILNENYNMGVDDTISRFDRCNQFDGRVLYKDFNQSGQAVNTQEQVSQKFQRIFDNQTTTGEAKSTIDYNTDINIMETFPKYNFINDTSVEGEILDKNGTCYDFNTQQVKNSNHFGDSKVFDDLQIIPYQFG